GRSLFSLLASRLAKRVCEQTSSPATSAMHVRSINCPPLNMVQAMKGGMSNCCATNLALMARGLHIRDSGDLEYTLRRNPDYPNLQPIHERRLPCRREKPSREPATISGRARRPRRKLASLYARRCITFVKVSTGHVQPSKPSRLGYRRR